MRKRAVWRAFGIGLLAATGYVLWRAIEMTRAHPELGGEPPPLPYPPPSQAAARPERAAVWVEPDEGACPLSHPVKAKLASGIYHEPRGASYARTRPDRCYRDAPSATADGLRAAKR